MTRIHFTDSDGNNRIIDADDGNSLMDAAVRNGITGIVADCCGACTCATCHVYIDEKWESLVGSPEWLENEMLELATHRKSNSRLSCQIHLSPKLDGLIVAVPDSRT